MFSFFKKKKINRHLTGAIAYLNREYQISLDTQRANLPRFSRESDVEYIRYSISTEPDVAKHTKESDTEQKSDVQFSLKDSGEVRYSLKDNYSVKSVNVFMQNIATSQSFTETSFLDESIDMSFVDKMLEHINRKQLRDSTVYKSAQVDRRLFSKIVSDRTYKPSKDTCIALILALQLPLDDATDMLSRAGYTLSHSSKRDVIIEYFIRENIYNINDINEILYRLGQKILGR